MADLTGRVCLVTGATRGLGRATAEALANMGATVLLHGRDSAAVGAVCREIQRRSGVPPRSVTGVVADFASLADVRRLAREITDRHGRLDVLVNNAGTVTMRRKPTADGFEWQLGINHLAPFLLTNLLLERLKASAPARIITVSSRAHRRGVLDFDDLNWERRKYDGLQAYGASKLANILFTSELARRLTGSGVTANCLHPGVVATNIFNHAGLAGRLVGLLARWRMLSPAKGAETSVFLASSPEVAEVSGRYLEKCAAVEPTPAAQDMAAAQRLWEISEQLTGLAE
jgi:NAD(P)-dependent dehydrogenase (short-subunit alcohol dehydrogenase family)